MRNERYSIEVQDDVVEINGYLTIREAFDYLNFFDREGFTCLAPGDQNSTIYLCRRDFTKPEIPEERELPGPYVAEKDIYETCYELKKAENEKLSERIRQLESLIKLLLEDKQLKPDTPELIKFLSGMKDGDE